VRQQTLAAQTGFEKYGRKTKRERFLEQMEQVVPWAESQGLVEPHYPKGENGRPPVGLSIMLRMYFLQQWFNLSDPGAEDAFVYLMFSGDEAMKPTASRDLDVHQRSEQ
jgi:IS5 family transposase